MSDPAGFEVSARPLVASDRPPMVFIPAMPSGVVLEGVGRAVASFAQLEYYLIVIYKRVVEGASLPEVIDKRGGDSLGALLNGVTNRGIDNNFEGLLKIADSNPQLGLVNTQLRKAVELAKVRKKYLHGGFSRRITDNKWVFLKTGDEISELQILQDLKSASTDIEKLIAEMQAKIPTPKPGPCSD